MIKKYAILLLLMSGLVSVKTHAEGFKYSKQFINYSGSLGYSLLNYSTNSFASGRVGLSLGAGYTWKYENEVFFSLSGEINYLSSQMYKKSLTVSKHRLIDGDSPADTLTMYSSLKDFKEFDNVFFFNLHPTVGYRFENGHYAIVGVKVGYSLMARARSKTSLTNTGVYDKYLGIFGDLPEQGFVTDKSIKGTSSLKMGLNVAATFEYGREMKIQGGDNVDDVLRIGVFLDYGLLNIYRQGATNKTVFSPNPQDPTLPQDLTLPQYLTDFTLHPVLTAKDFSGSTKTIFTGLKLTYYFCTGKTCSCNRTQNVPRDRHEKKKKTINTEPRERRK